jgi:NADH:ubiquinone oxidoreductase subunit 6 (subunit J)
MRWNPILNAAGATAYIGAVAFFTRFIQSVRHDTPDTLLDGMGVLSLLVFSAAVMAFIFFYQPVVLLIENKKKEALSYFLKTLGAFGLITVCVLSLISFQ